MPLNLLKVYNQLLDLIALDEATKTRSLRGVFDRDITRNAAFNFRGKRINPTPGEEEPLERLFNHLTTTVVDKASRHREYERKRSERIHWIKTHIEEVNMEVLVFSVKEADGTRTYVFDQEESYVIVLEPYRNGEEYYLLSAYYVENREKFLNKYTRRRLPEIL